MAGRKRNRGKEEVELNLAAMLDMAFQLLTFFILTFKPAPVEGDIALRLPPPQPITGPGPAAPGDNDKNRDLPQDIKSLIVSVVPDSAGRMASMAIGEAPIGFSQLEDRLKKILGDPSSAFDQVLIQVGSDLHYEALMNVVDICTRQKLSDGKPLSKLSFVEMPGG